MQAEEFLHLAEELAFGDSEAGWRTAISRSYYAAFHVARNLLRSLGFAVPRSDQAHAFIRSRLYGSGQIDVQQTGEALRDLRLSRNQADYNLDRPVFQAAAAAQVSAAGNIIRVLNAAFTEPFRSRIIEAIRRHERDVLNEVTWHPD